MNELGESKNTIDLQKKFDEKRANVTKTVSEIRTTVTKEVEQRKEAFGDAKASIKKTVENAKATVKETLDVEKQFQKRPLEMTAGAVVVGVLVGMKLFARNVGAVEYDYYRAMTSREPAADARYRNYEPSRSGSEESFQKRQRARMARKSPFAALLALAVAEGGKVAGRVILPMVLAAITGKAAVEGAAEGAAQGRRKKIVVVRDGASVDEETLSGLDSRERKTIITDVNGDDY